MSEIYLILMAIGFTLIMVGFFSGYEIAFVSANRLSIELKKKQGRRGGLLVAGFIENQAKFIGTCLIGVNTFLVIYGLLFNELLHQTLWNPFNIENDYIKLIADTLLSTFVVLILGEFLPKAIFKAKNDSLVDFFAPVAHFFYTIFKPVATFLVNISLWILKYMFNVRVNEKNEAFTKVDLEHFFQQTVEQDEEMQELNTELFENALSLPMVKIRQCLVPRTEIECIEVNDSIDALKQQFIQTKLSKLVVYEENIDNIVGYVHQLDLFKKPATIKEVIHPIIAVPESMSASDLMNKFTKDRKSLAWVVDEFGGTAGIVTMEDVLEEIFGEIRDEYDTEEFVEKQLSEDEFIFSGRMELDIIHEKYGLEFEEESSETLSGYIIRRHETIPAQKEIIVIDNYRFDILSVSEKRIEMVKLKILR